METVAAAAQQWLGSVGRAAPLWTLLGAITLILVALSRRRSKPRRGATRAIADNWGLYNEAESAVAAKPNASAATPISAPSALSDDPPPVVGAFSSSALPKDRVSWMDGLRGAAALSVAWFHLYTQNGGRLVLDGTPDWITHLAVVGRYGVELFFVISGFVLAYTLLPRTDILRVRDVVLYVVRRSIRLDPTYWFVLAIYVAAQPIFLHFDLLNTRTTVLSPEKLIASVLYFLPRSEAVGLYVPVAWTLAIEVQFYLLFSSMVLLINRVCSLGYSRHVVIQCVIGTMIVLSALPLLGLINVPIGYWMYPHLYAFAVGAAAAMVHMKTPRSLLFFAACLILVAIGAARVGVLTALGTVHEDQRALATLLVGLVLAACIAFPMLRRFLGSSVFLYLGALSYCVYLLHHVVGGPVVELLQTLFDRPGIGQIAVVLVGLAATLIAAAIVHYLVEKPSIRWSKQIRFGVAKGTAR